MMEAGNECTLGGVVIIGAAFRKTDYGETDISMWGLRTCLYCNWKDKVPKLLYALRRSKDVLANCFPPIFI